MSIASIGLSGIKTARLAAQTTAHNIANVNTPAYKREQLQISAAQTGGVQATNTVQIRDKHYAEPLARDASTQLSQQSKTNTQLNTTLKTAQLFDLPTKIQSIAHESLPQIANDPTNIAPRKTFISQLDDLASSYNQLDSQLSKQLGTVNTELDQLHTQLENTLTAIADNNTPGNHMDQMIEQVAELTQITIETRGSAVDIYTNPNHYPLVVGDRAQVPIDPDNLHGGGIQALTDSVQTIQQTQNQLRQNMNDLVDQVNTQHEAGYDLNGDPGQPILEFDGRTVTVLIDDPQQVAASADDQSIGDNQNIQPLIDQVSASAAPFVNWTIDMANTVEASNNTLALAQTLHDSAQEQIQSLSGVNLDQEAADLIKWQQLYSANAQVIDTASIMFDTILSLRN